MWFAGGTRYVAVAAFVSGAAQANPDLMPGFHEYVAVAHSKAPSLGWPGGVLVACGFEQPKRAEVLRGGGDDEENAAAIAALFRIIRAYAECAAKDGELAEILVEYEAQEVARRRPRGSAGATSSSTPST